jgi:hypothetical protein
MTSHRAAGEAVEAALVEAGLRVALDEGDISPPCAYLELWTDDPETGTLDGSHPVTVAVHWIPVRGLRSFYADLDAADTIVAALVPFATVANMSRATVLVGETTSWPCLRWEAIVQP